MADRNTLHIRPDGKGAFDIEIFPIGTYDTIKETGLSAEQVAARLLAAPESIDVLSFDAKGEDVVAHDAIRAELRKHNRDFLPSRSCPRCNDARTLDGAPCPACSVPWTGQSK